MERIKEYLPTVALVVGLVLLVGIGHALWRDGHQFLAAVYGAAGMGAAFGYMKLDAEIDRLRAIIRKAEEETGREFKLW